MEKYFVTYKQAVALKEIGYNKYSWFGMECSLYKADGNHTFYANGIGDETYISAPLKSQVFEWGRKKYGLHHVVHHFEHKKDTPQEFLAEVSGQLVMLNDDISCFSYHSTYEEAESACIDTIIEIIKNK